MLIRADLAAYVRPGDHLHLMKCILTSHSFHLVCLYRLGSALARIRWIGGVFRVVFEYLIRVLYASDISLRSTIGPGLKILHGHDIVIGAAVVIGKNCKIFNGVSLGNRDTESDVDAQPRVGDHVVIGSGAKLLGGIRIGDGVRVGANAVVLMDVPNHAVVAGVPAKVIKSLQAPA